MENKYYLAIETKPKNYFPINLLDLNISQKFNTFNLDELDRFTLKYTKAEIIKSIKEANLLEVNDDMSLIVIYYEKNVIRKCEALTKDINFNMWQNIKENYNDKIYLNIIYNFLANKVDNETLKELKNCKELNKLLSVISNLPYIIQRKLYFYLYEK